MPEPLTLRPYQQTDVEALRAAYGQGARAVLYQLATGGGKTVVFATTVGGAAGKGRRTAVVVHRRELVRQASAKLAWAGVPHGIVAAELDRDHDAPVLVCSIQTLRHRLDLVPIGIHSAIAEGTGLAPDAIHFALRWWCSQHAYRRAIAAGGVRFNLDGTPAGEISADDRHHARMPSRRPSQ